jgi:RNA polymerase sigma-70 factor (ECF subfamily)
LATDPAETLTGSPLVASAAPDEALMMLIRDGDAMALHELMQRYWRPLLAYAGRIAADDDAAADLVQQTFIRLWQQRERWTPTGTVSAYVHRIARNAALNERRAHNARTRRDEQQLRAESASPWTPLECLEQKELETAFRAALLRLPSRRKEVYLLAKEEKLSYLEISARLGISPQTVANHLSAAMLDLRRHLRELLER